MRSPWARIKRPPFFFLNASARKKAPNEIYLNFLPYGVGRPRNGPGEPERQRHANLPAEAKK